MSTKWRKVNSEGLTREWFQIIESYDFRKFDEEDLTHYFTKPYSHELICSLFSKLGYGDSFLVHTHEGKDDDEDFVYLETQFYPIRDHWGWGATIYEQINLESLTKSKEKSCQTVISSYGDYSKDQIQEVAEIYLVKYNLTSVLFYNNYDQWGYISLCPNGDLEVSWSLNWDVDVTVEAF